MRIVVLLTLIVAVLIAVAGVGGDNHGSFTDSITINSESPSTTEDSQKLGYVLYMTGIQPHARGLKTAEERVTYDFTPEFRSFVESGWSYEPAFFCYRSSGGYAGPDAVYTHDDPVQPPQDSADALDEQIRDLISNWQEERGNESVPEIVIMGHSLGGAITAYWASYAEEDLLSAVRTVFTFDSPLKAELKSIRDYMVAYLLAGGSLPDVLKDEYTMRMIVYGTQRLDFVSFGNAQDMIMPDEYSHTDYCWQSVTVDYCPPFYDPRYLACHFCVFDTEQARNTIAAALDATPPLYSNQAMRPPAMDIPQKSTLPLWIWPIVGFVVALMVLIYVVIFMRLRRRR